MKQRSPPEFVAILGNTWAHHATAHIFFFLQAVSGSQREVLNTNRMWQGGMGRRIWIWYIRGPWTPPPSPSDSAQLQGPCSPGCVTPESHSIDIQPDKGVPDHQHAGAACQPRHSLMAQRPGEGGGGEVRWWPLVIYQNAVKASTSTKNLKRTPHPCENIEFEKKNKKTIENYAELLAPVPLSAQGNRWCSCTETNQTASHWEFKNVGATKQSKTMQSKNSRCWHRGMAGYIEIVICIVTNINQSLLDMPMMCKVHNCTILNTKEAMCDHMHVMLANAKRKRAEWCIACNVVLSAINSSAEGTIP